ncbi:basic-leucine zipper transcription factor A-like [Anopheles marshallii]|uniref:basic-leucine zipper transcription factor A-like n=1 Tax=Anopheles marshallii TaxID=1521116 RepID=UPI00237BDFEA|nr:basic-leucine zipper transcription factor A-like [Anopheles marshallii]
MDDKGALREATATATSSTFLLGLTLAEKKNVTEQTVETPTAAKEKRQTEHETRAVPLSLIAARRQQALHHQQQQEYYQSEEGSFYAAQPAAGQPPVAYKSSGGAHKTANSQEQPQYQELPPEYISLLHQLAEHQPKASALKQGKAVSQQYEPQSHAQHTKPNQVQYITEEEYAQLLKQAQQQQGPAAAHHQHHHQHQQPPQGLQAYGRPAAAHGAPTAAHKYRPAIQLLETAEEQPGSYGPQDGEQYRIQYKSIQQAGTVTPVQKPVSSFSFENELAKLVESNRPLAYHQVPHHPGRQQHDSQHDAQRYGPTPSPQSHEYTYVQAGPAHGREPQPPKQSIKAQYIAPFAQGLQLSGPKISPAHLQVGPQKFVDSAPPAQKYQFIAQPESVPSKAHHHHQQQQQQHQHHHHQAPAHQGQQYFAEVSPKQQAGTPSPKIQYYIPKEKNVQIYYQQAQQQQQSVIEQHSPQHPMKIVEAPQLQNEKPQKTVQSLHRSKPAEQQQVHQHRYAPREKQPESAADPHAPSRSAIFVSQSTGVNQATAAATPAPSAHPHKIPPKIDRPLTQEEFQALVDAGYSVVPVPVPVPVPISQYQQQAAHHAGHGGAPHPGPRGGPHPTPAVVARQAAQASRYHLHQLATAENNPNQVVTYLRPLHLDPFSAGVRGPHKAAP